MTLRKQQSAYDSMHREDADASSGVAPQVKRTCPGITFCNAGFLLFRKDFKIRNGEKHDPRDNSSR